MSDPTTQLLAANRRGTHSAKWDLLAAPYGEGAISLSVADIEFQTAPVVSAAVIDAAQRANYGYTEVFADFYQAATRWQKSHHQWGVESDSATFFPRIIEAVSAVLSWRTRTYGRPLRVVTLAPYYSPILEVVHRWDAEVTPVRMDFANQPATFDILALEKALIDADLLLWCNPHNPSGRVWQTQELRQVAQLCQDNQVLVISDDIHADFTTEGHKYAPLAKVAPRLWEDGLLLQCASPGKTFAMAGLEAAVIFGAPQLLCALEDEKRKLGLHNPNYFAIPAAIAAWTRGDQWAEELRLYVNKNLTNTREALLNRCPELSITATEGTFLQWIDASKYLSEPEDLERIQTRSRVLITPGADFGPGYQHFFRLNVAVPSPVLREGIDRLSHALTNL